MSDHQPPSGTPEYLESGGGRPIVPDQVPPEDVRPRPRGRRRTAWVAAIAVVLLVGGGAAAWAVMSFFRQGAQPAEALPASTVAYLSVDLDPAGSQKIDAFRTLNKFPAFEDEVGVNSPDDVRRKIGESILDELSCNGMSYDDDIEPWLGDRAAVAAVDLGHDNPATVLVIQVKDDDGARGALKALAACDDSSPSDQAFHVEHGWALLSDSQDDLDQIAAATDQGSLADDPTYQKWVDRLGDSGVVTMYAAPKVGAYLADKVDEWVSILADPASAFEYSSDETPVPSEAIDPDGKLADELRSFTGAAATVRFTGSGVELAVVSDARLPGTTGFTGDQAGTAVSRLPDDTAAAFAVSLKPGWVQSLAGRMSPAFGRGTSQRQFYRLVEQWTGLALPGDLETLFGTSTTISLGGDFDYEAFSNASDPSQFPVGAVVTGEPAKVEAVLDELRGSAADLDQLLGSDSAGDRVAIGPSADYRQDLLTDGQLGDTDAFRSVVPSTDHASEVIFVNMDQFQKSIEEAAGSDPEVVDNLAPLQAIGFSVWLDDDLGRISFKVSTD